MSHHPIILSLGLISVQVLTMAMIETRSGEGLVRQYH